MNQSDLDPWLANAGIVLLASNHPFLPADANLDGVVDGSDFGIWNAHKFQSSDMGIRVVPEPSSWVFMIAIAACVSRLRGDQN